MLPTIDFPTIDDLIDYIDVSIITNHNNEIIAVQHNNIENGLSKFIIQAPRNWNTAKTIASVGNYVASTDECFLIFKSTGTGSVTLTDNKWNEWVIVNRTPVNKQLTGSISSYRTVANTIKNYIPTLTSVSIAKGDDGLWYETSNSVAPNPVRPRFSATLDGQEEKSLLDINGNIFLISANTSNKMLFTLSCSSDVGDTFILEYEAKVDSIGSNILLYPVNEIPFWDNPYDGTSFNIIVGADNSFKGIRITVTGVDGKVIQCEAEFNNTAFNI